MKTTCEIMVQRVLPAIRAELARCMICEHGKNQQEVAEVLELSRAAVSQYVNDKRGAEVDFSEEAQQEIKRFAASLLEGMKSREQVAGMCNVCKFVQRSGWLNKNEPYAGYCVLCGDGEVH
ncbi:transcriptional regulator [Methanolobus mangrovi]|uniref:Transcriptional regulator n=1 Tax=Methanolobus mangrovi TaxID=3072977 RepID=A0AA51YGE2_9EURY|nr:transcriptional regulator [Methanolobus mangrovi]WMW21946.1 transcriptional regulator [Methanolobus mangrovi]